MQNALRPARETSEHDRRRVPRRDRVREGDLRLHELEAHADADTAAEARRLLVESQSGASLDAVGNYGFPAEAAESAIENMVGSIQVPMGVAGPVSVDGGSVAGEKYLPSRPPRARSSRRSTAVARSSTAPAADRPRPQVRDDPRAGVPRRRRCRGRGARLVDPRQLRGAEGGRGGTTNHGELLDVTPYVVGNSVYLRDSATTPRTRWG